MNETRSATIHIAVVIPVLNGWDLTRRCLDALNEHRADDGITQVIVVDDGSTDETRERLKVEPRVTPVIRETNGGFAAACNAGARAAVAVDALLFLNNDAFVGPRTIAALSRPLADPTIGIVGPKLVYDDGTIQNAGMFFTKRGVEVLHYHLDGDCADAAVARDYIAVSGAALLIRRVVFERLGGFDEAYVNGVEDIDLCVRAWQLGYRVRYEPSAVLVHVEGATRGRTPADSSNHARLWARFASVRRTIPLVDVPPAPVYFVDTRGAHTTLENAVAKKIVNGLRRFGGAPTEEVAHHWDVARGRLRAIAESRAIRTIAVGRAPSGADILYVAPLDHEQATLARWANVREWWAPTNRTVERLIAAGTPREQTHLVFLGIDPDAIPPVAPARNAGVVILIDGRDGAAVDAIAARLPMHSIALLSLEDDARHARGLIDHCRLLIVLAEDGYGTLVPAALAAGCLVATVPDGRAPWCTERTAVLAPLASLADHCVDALADTRLAATLRANARADMARLFPRSHGFGRMRELARVSVHGSMNGASVEITPKVAARLQLGS